MKHVPGMLKTFDYGEEEFDDKEFDEAMERFTKKNKRCYESRTRF